MALAGLLRLSLLGKILLRMVIKPPNMNRASQAQLAAPESPGRAPSMRAPVGCGPHLLVFHVWALGRTYPLQKSAGRWGRYSVGKP